MSEHFWLCQGSHASTIKEYQNESCCAPMVLALSDKVAEKGWNDELED